MVLTRADGKADLAVVVKSCSCRVVAGMNFLSIKPSL